MNKKWAVKRITINLASAESKKLEKYCASTGRPATDVIRELIRSLSITELSASEQNTSTLKDDVPILK
ncbi:MAG: CopG family transcriptional regulator [Nostoc sp. EfeVER01]|uniref:CopG family transcriptional regulator n=1 Tax=Nostoc sp. EfeVER01 TaxID=3075406 RepID=UPI002AD1E1B8|nr:CopG family transcriptional regulator [Nostoc sp. EfeVER01]MDZ7943455.1 CopG family transcriptional regulator [Nostoc sp. EfeVER01]